MILQKTHLIIFNHIKKHAILLLSLKNIMERNCHKIEIYESTADKKDDFYDGRNIQDYNIEYNEENNISLFSSAKRYFEDPPNTYGIYLLLSFYYGIVVSLNEYDTHYITNDRYKKNSRYTTSFSTAMLQWHKDQMNDDLLCKYLDEIKQKYSLLKEEDCSANNMSFKELAWLML